MEDYQDHLRISTPEGVEVDLVLAGLGSRFISTLIDLFLKFLLILGALLLGALIDGDLGLAVFAVLSFVAYFGYDILFEVFSGGRTPGKRWTGLRVLRDDGRPVDPLSSAIRNILRLIDGITFSYLPAMVSVMVTRRNQRLGDLAARTIVVREPRAKGRRRRGHDAGQPIAPPPPGGPAAPAFAGFAPPQGVDGHAPAGTLPGGGRLDLTAITPEDLAAVRSFLERRHTIEADVRADLAQRLASALAPRIGGAVDGVPPERLLLLVAEKGRGAGRG